MKQARGGQYNMLQTKKKAFGKELEGILGISKHALNQEPATKEAGYVHKLPISTLKPGAFQPRKNFDLDSLQELATSIKSQGILQPLVVRKVGEKYEIIIGERRWRAAKMAGLNQVPAMLVEISDEAALAYGVIENIQRKELNAIEEAHALQRLLQEFSMTHEQVAQAVGKSRTSITNLLRLLSLPTNIQVLLVDDKIEMGHARTILTLPENEQNQIAQQIIEKMLSVRDVESLVKKIKSGNAAINQNQIKVEQQIPRKIQELERQLSKKFSAKVDLRVNSAGDGKVVIFFDNIEEVQLWVK
jgi:ParB family transcriptional regulator, chromosome partitioning protein